MDIILKLAEEFKIRKNQVEDTVKLIDEGNTIPFIARYRKEVTGNLSDVVLRDLNDRLNYLRNLETRKEEVIASISEQGKLTDELRDEIMKAEVLQRVEDLYKPYKKKKATRATKAKERGLEPLSILIYLQNKNDGDLLTIAEEYVNPDKEVNTKEDAINGALDIIAENISDDAEINKMVREKTIALGDIVTEATDEKENTVYNMYYGRSEKVNKIPNHRILAINRGEDEKKLKCKVVMDNDTILNLLSSSVITNKKSISYPYLVNAIEDSYKRLIAPSIEREIRNMLTERAELEAVKIFAKNLENLLMGSPVKDKRVLAIDPGYRTGCKVAMLDETGKLMEYTTIYPTEPKCDVIGTEKTLYSMIQRCKAQVIVIGNGTASRETEEVVANFINKNKLDLQYTIVNEAGASVYSASKLASEEYPELDVTTRGAMSLGRRLQDPLSELVKIDPKSIGVGQYQHDVNQKLLEGALTNVVEDCVNRVGVDLNTASPSLLSYISGINMGIAKNIVSYREANGKFKDRKELLKVSKLGEKAYKQCAGFLRISDGKNKFDSTSIHPESYDIAGTLLKELGLSIDEIGKEQVQDIDNRIKLKYGTVKNMAAKIGIGELTLNDIISEMKKPARDPRDNAPKVIFRNDVRSFEDLKVDMEMTGTVRNVVDFGCFVDIGVKNDGLVHISELSTKFVKHPMDVVSVGDTVKVKILSIDYDKKKVALTMKGLN